MEIFIHQRIFREQMAARPNLTERLLLLRLLAEKEAKNQHPPRKMERSILATTDQRITMKIAKYENLKRLRELLTRTSDETECQQIVNLIEEKEAKKSGR